MFVAGLFAADGPARGGLQRRLKYAVGRGRRDQNAVKIGRFGYRPGLPVGVQTRFGGCTRWRQAQSISVPRVLGGAGRACWIVGLRRPPVETVSSPPSTAWVGTSWNSARPWTARVRSRPRTAVGRRSSASVPIPAPEAATSKPSRRTARRRANSQNHEVAMNRTSNAASISGAAFSIDGLAVQFQLASSVILVGRVVWWFHVILVRRAGTLLNDAWPTNVPGPDRSTRGLSG